MDLTLQKSQEINSPDCPSKFAVLHKSYHRIKSNTTQAFKIRFQEQTGMTRSSKPESWQHTPQGIEAVRALVKVNA
jgi:hypothetical protein